MSTAAVRFLPAWLPSFATSDVLLLSHQFHVGRIDAVSDTAKMVYLKAAWDGANQKLVGITMCPNWMPTYLELAVTIALLRCSPQPACLGLVHLCPEPRFSRVHWQ